MPRFSWKNDEAQEEKVWERMRRRGHLFVLASTTSLIIASYVVIRLIHIGCFKIGWLKSPGETSIEVIIICTVSSLIVPSGIGRD